jgi:hypothetical protein
MLSIIYVPTLPLEAHGKIKDLWCESKWTITSTLPDTLYLLSGKPERKIVKENVFSWAL